MLLFALFQRPFFKGYDGFWCVKLRGTLIGLSLIPLIFYSYNGIIGKSPDFVNIAIFFIAAAIAYLYETRAFNDGGIYCKSEKTALGMILAIALLFVLFTFKAPEINLFKDPLTSEYGI